MTSFGKPPNMILALSLSASLSRRGGGIFDVTRRLSQAIASVGIATEAFGLEDEFTDQDRFRWESVNTGVFQVRGPRSIGYSPHLMGALTASDAFLLHQHGLWMYPSLACLQWAKVTRRPYVVSPHGMLDPWALTHSRWRKRLAGWLFQNAHLKGAACLHALCESEAGSIRAYGLRNPICVIPNGIDLPEQYNERIPPWEGQIEVGKKALLFLGRVHPKKGLRQLLNGWAEARQVNPSAAFDWTLVIAGWDQGGHEDELRRQTREMQVDDSVVFVGPLFNERKAAALENAEAFILPSFSEGLPMAVLEAWAYELPVVMTPECNLPEGFEAKAAIQTKTSGNEIARSLGKLWEMSDAERTAMGKRGRALVEERFTWKKAAEQMKSVYEWVLGRGARPDCVRLD
jgi:glycosyltransferase involved in cell wall biosynthesis